MSICTLITQIYLRGPLKIARSILTLQVQKNVSLLQHVVDLHVVAAAAELKFCSSVANSEDTPEF